jgi:hypothetical protein
MQERVDRKGKVGMGREERVCRKGREERAGRK